MEELLPAGRPDTRDDVRVKYLLDTNICIFVIKQKPASVLNRCLQESPDEVAISSVTLAELRYGADKKVLHLPGITQPWTVSWFPSPCH